MVFIHILSGLTALTAGALALFATKGSLLHRRAGTVFVGAMLVMASTAALLATFSVPDRAHVVGSLLVIYLVCTGYLTVWRPVKSARRAYAIFMVLGLALGLYALGIGVEGVKYANGMVDGESAQVMFVFGGVALIAGLLDGRLLHAGHIHGGHRLARHLWRMGFAMLIATASLFIGQPDFFPAAMKAIEIRAIPPLVVMIIPAYWLVRLALIAIHAKVGCRSVIRSTIPPVPGNPTNTAIRSSAPGHRPEALR